MTMDVRHIRSANMRDTGWTTLVEARAALIGVGYDNALMQDLYVTGDGLAAQNDSGTLTGLLRITADHRIFFYYLAITNVVFEVEFIFAFA